MIVAIHQPNYLPWLGYFAKIARADAFIFLDDVQFSKGSYTNRVQIARGGKPAWLTLPVRHSFGDNIHAVKIARDDWARAHADILKQAYGSALHFKEVWPTLETWLDNAGENLSEVNTHLIKQIAIRLGFATRFELSSLMQVESESADHRLALLVAQIAPGATYLSGHGGANYQSEQTFKDHGLKLIYSDFKPQSYARSGDDFLPGLSIVDALFHLGWQATASMLDGAS